MSPIRVKVSASPGGPSTPCISRASIIRRKVAGSVGSAEASRMLAARERAVFDLAGPGKRRRARGHPARRWSAETNRGLPETCRTRPRREPKEIQACPLTGHEHAPFVGGFPGVFAVARMRPAARGVGDGVQIGVLRTGEEELAGPRRHRFLGSRDRGGLVQDLADGGLHLAAAAEDADRQGDEQRRDGHTGGDQLQPGTPPARRARARSGPDAAPARSSRSGRRGPPPGSRAWRGGARRAAH